MKTEKAPEGLRRVVDTLPQSWHALKWNLDDAFVKLGLEDADMNEEWTDVSMRVLPAHSLTPQATLFTPRATLYACLRVLW